MTTSPVETRTNPASAVLEGRLAGEAAVSEELALLAGEQAGIGGELARLIARMRDPRLDEDALDGLVERITGLLSRAEDVRASRARVTARLLGDERRWRDYLDPA